METNGVCGVTGRMCSEKWKALKNRVKQINKRLKQTWPGRPRGGGMKRSGAAPTWPYYDKMVHLTRNDPTINPNNIIEAGAAPYNRIRRPRVILNENFICMVVYVLHFV